jgi:hypothetical protein
LLDIVSKGTQQAKVSRNKQAITNVPKDKSLKNTNVPPQISENSHSHSASEVVFVRRLNATMKARILGDEIKCGLSLFSLWQTRRSVNNPLAAIENDQLIHSEMTS